MIIENQNISEQEYKVYKYIIAKAKNKKYMLDFKKIRSDLKITDDEILNTIDNLVLKNLFIKI